MELLDRYGLPVAFLVTIGWWAKPWIELIFRGHVDFIEEATRAVREQTAMLAAVNERTEQNSRSLAGMAASVRNQAEATKALADHVKNPDSAA